MRKYWNPSWGRIRPRTTGKNMFGAVEETSVSGRVEGECQGDGVLNGCW